MIQLCDQGALIYPDFNFFRLVKGIDQLYSKHLTKGTNEVYANVISDIRKKEIELFFPCEDHKYDIVAELIYSYVLVGKYHFRRDERKNKKSETKNLKKCPN